MMKYLSKLAYLLGLPVLVGMLSLCFMGVANGQTLPEGYTQETYVKSEGSGYIDTEYVLTNRSSVEIKVKVMGIVNATAQQLFGNKVNTQKAVVLPATNMSTARFGNQHKVVTLNGNLGNPYIYKINSGGIWVNGTQKITWDDEIGEFETEGSFYLFASRGRNGPSLYTRSGTKIYWVKVEEDGVLSFDGIPCKFGDEYGIYDTIENEFHPLKTGGVDMDDDDIIYVSDGTRIFIPDSGLLHRPRLHSLYLSATEPKALIRLKGEQLEVRNGLIMGFGNSASNQASYVTIGGGTDNKIEGEVEKSGIGGGVSNTITTSNSVIGGGEGNYTTGDGVNTIGGGMANRTLLGGTVVGGSNNIAEGKGVIIGGQNNRLGGNASMVLGSNSYGGHGSFSWNSPFTQDNSAVIMADDGVLIGTYEPITGVNLVVNGAVKIGESETGGTIGEIRMISGCFYGYDGYKWHLISQRISRDECGDMACIFGSTLFKEGDEMSGYTAPYAEDCSTKLTTIMCNSDGTLGMPDVQYYPYCYNLSGYGIPSSDLEVATCGPANGLSYESVPSDDDLCTTGTPSVVNQSNPSYYTWTCSGINVVTCGSTRIYSCGGTEPSGNGIRTGSSSYTNGHNPTSWEYITQGLTPGACQWTCEGGYTPSGNGCIAQGAHCGAASGGRYETPQQVQLAGLCNIGNGISFNSSSTGFTWSCTHLTSTVNCSATRVYPCGGEEPTGVGVNKITNAGFYTSGYSPTSWFYQSLGNLGACQWRCYAGYERSGNTCVEASAQCGSASGGEFVTEEGELEAEQIKNDILKDGACAVGDIDAIESTIEGFTWKCVTASSSISCSASRLYQAKLVGDNDDMNDFEYGAISLGGMYIMDRNLGANKRCEPGDGSSYDPDCMGYFYEWGNNYGFSKDEGCRTENLEEDEMDEVCEYIGGGNVNPSSCVNPEFVCTKDGPWYYDPSYPSGEYDFWGAQGTNEDKKGPCPDGWHVPSVDDVNKMLDTWEEENPGNCAFNEKLFFPRAGLHTAYEDPMLIPINFYPSDLKYFYGVFQNTEHLWVVAPEAFWLSSIAKYKDMPAFQHSEPHKRLFATAFSVDAFTVSNKCEGRVDEDVQNVLTELGLSIRCFKNM